MSDIEKRLAKIEVRNRRVEADKDGELAGRAGLQLVF
jgi:hypothetical protein